MQNEPIFKIIEIMLTPFYLKTKASSLKSASQKNKPNSKPFSLFLFKEKSVKSHQMTMLKYRRLPAGILIEHND